MGKEKLNIELGRVPAHCNNFKIFYLVFHQNSVNICNVTHKSLRASSAQQLYGLAKISAAWLRAYFLKVETNCS